MSSGFIRASLNLVGKQPDLMEVLTTSAIMEERVGNVFFSKDVRMGSSSQLLDGHAFINLFIPSIDTSVKLSKGGGSTEPLSNVSQIGS